MRKQSGNNVAYATDRIILISLLVGLVLLTLVGSDANAQSSDCSRRAVTTREVDLMEQPPSYSTKDGWVSGKRVGRIPKNASLQICEERMVGFFNSKQRWFRIRWENQLGWLDGAAVAERRVSQAGLWQGLEQSLFPVAHAQTGEGGGPEDPPLLLGSFLFILAGMIGKALFDLFRGNKQWAGVRRFISKLIPSLVVSPLVFQGFIQTANLTLTDEFSLLVLFLFAFQNGFFWQDILTRGHLPEGKPGESEGLGRPERRLA